MHKGTLLFVDDEAPILHTLVRLYRPLGYRTLTAQSGYDALELLKTESVDLIIADMRMPKMSGATFFSNVSEKYPHIMRILLTGHSDLASTIEAINEGNVYRYVEKPWENDELKVIVEKALEYKKLADERNSLLSLTQKQNEQLLELNSRLEKEILERDRLAAKLDRELKLAAEVQSNLLPTPANNGTPIAAINAPAGVLSGDFYDFFPLSDGRILFSLGDVSGKGTNAALLMSITNGLFRCIGKQLSNPSQIIRSLNKELYETGSQNMFVTMIAGSFNPQTNLVQLVNAGHLPAILISKDGSVEHFNSQVLPLGINPDFAISSYEFSLQGKRLVLFSDGLVETTMNNGEELGVEGLIKMFAAPSKLTPQARIEDFVLKIKKTSGKPSCDDMTMLVLSEMNH